MRKLQLLLMMLFVFAGYGVQAQNTGLLPYKDSKHSYEISRGMTGTTLTWSVLEGVAGVNYDLVVDSGDDQIVEVTWKEVGVYTLQVKEHRTDISATIANGCPVIRTITVDVKANDFDVYAELVTDSEACANVSPAIVVDAGTLGSNLDDNFGTTTRVFNVRSTGLQATLDWNFTYNITHVGDAGIGDYSVVVDNANATDVSGDVVVNAGTNLVTITVTYQTNKNRQDSDFDLSLSVSDVTDVNGTPEKDNAAPTNNSVLYKVRAVPATTGITVIN